MANFTDPMNPPGRLQPPGSYGDQVKHDIDQALGMIHYVVNLIDHFTGWNIEQEMLDWVGGNYGQLLSIRDCWNNAGWALDDMNTNLTSGLSTVYGQSNGAVVDPHWSGNAADGFYRYMTEWGAALDEDRDACFLVRDQMNQLAEQAKDTITVILQGIKTLVSLLGSASASIEIPAWGEFEIAKAVWEAIKLINNIRKIVSAFINTVKVAIDTFHELTDLAKASNPTLQVNVPAAAYGGPANPGV
ncbi:MAG TPA: hypothetical protein VG317_18250 [Pseudonocardiaceae bacterium]|nr:hypothetical protein [Pseudonocardiaceae bacterium]